MYKCLFKTLLSVWGSIYTDGIAGSHDNSMFNFLRTAMLFFKAGVPFYIPTNGTQGFQVLYILPTLVILCSFGFFSSHLNEYEVLPHCFICIFLMVSNVKGLFMYLLTTCISSLEKCLFKFFAHF